jgi:glycine cleavage system H protein
MIPDNLHYTDTHEWVRVEGDFAFIGITDHAQKELGEILYIAELPEEGDEIACGDTLGAIEIAKSVEEIISPLSGEIVKVNSEVVDSPEVIHQSPYDEGWIIKVKMNNPEELEKLLTPEQYTKLLNA